MPPGTLRSSTVVAIILRLFAIYWAAQALLHLAVDLSAYLSSSVSLAWQNLIPTFLMPVLYGILAMLAWIFAGALAAKASGPQDPAVPLRQLERADIYGFGILIIGLYFFLIHIGPSINEIHYLALVKQDPERGFYELTSQLIPCVAGLALAIGSPRLGRKLASKTADPAAPEA